MCRVLNTFIVTVLFKLTLAAAPTEVLFLLSSQDSDYHRRLSARLRNNIIEQSLALPTSDYIINIRIVHEIFSAPGHWALLNVLTHPPDDEHGAAALFGTRTSWVVWCEESTHVSLQSLLEQLSLEDATQALYLGHALHDHEATIIHHFAYFENPKWFPYPMLRAGVVFSIALLKSLAAAAAADTRQPTYMASGSAKRRYTDFSIDAAHELARFIYDNVQATRRELLHAAAQQQSHSDNVAAAGDAVRSSVRWHKRRQDRYTGSTDKDDDSSGSSSSSGSHDGTSSAAFKQQQQKVLLRQAAYICPQAKTALQVSAGAGAKCALYAQPMDMSACSPVRRQHIYFAVKTCRQYHKERLPIIAATWAQATVHLRYFSDFADDDVPTISTGVPNVETGHCAKTLAILKLAFKDIDQMNRQTSSAGNGHIHWLVLTDDDTMLSVAGIAQLLGCFNHTQEIYLGERYGYRLHAADGFNYITGGGGIVFSLPTVARILQHCSCPTASAPDDMVLGACLHALQVPPIHSPRFHQARANDYARALLTVEAPISFHKFWQLDPLDVYERYFASADRDLLRLEATLVPLRRPPDALNANGNVSTKQRGQLHSRCPLSAAAAKEAASAHCRRKLTPHLASAQQHGKDTHLEL